MPITRHDVRTFTPDQIAEGWRLACLVQATRDLKVEVPPLTTRPKAATVGVGRQVILRPALQKRYVELDEPTLADQRTDLVRLTDAITDLELTADLHVLRRLATVLREADFKVTAVIVDEDLIDIEAGDTTALRYAIAFDLGTTTVVATLLDLGTGTPIAVASMLNKQQPFGGDVISRISATMIDPGMLDRLQQAAGDTLDELARQVCREGGVDPWNVYEVAVAGNATMTALVAGHRPGAARRRAVRDVHRAAADGARPRPRASTCTRAPGPRCSRPSARTSAATSSPACSPPAWTATSGPACSSTSAPTARSCSATATPSCPPPRPPGRRSRAARSAAACAPPTARSRPSSSTATATTRSTLGVIGDVEPRGLCGSGLVDAVAELVKLGLLDSSGRFVPDHVAAEIAPALSDRLTRIGEERVFVLHRPTPDTDTAETVYLSQRDVRELQFAKAAISTGWSLLLEQLGLEHRDVQQVLLAGSFGTYLSPASAVRIGLVPKLPVLRIVAAGNVAGEGAKMALLSIRERAGAQALLEEVTYVELSDRPDFNDKFVEQLGFNL